MKYLFYLFFTFGLMTSPLWAMDHSKFISGEYETPNEVTQDCMSCHPNQISDFMKTAHWLWKGPTPYLIGHEKDTHIGKINLMNNF